jgi:hypothetical protein
MFHANRARQGAANPISGGTSPTAARGSGVRSRLLVVLAVLTLLGGIHVGTAAAAIQAAHSPQPEPSTSATTGPPERVVEPNQTAQPAQTPDQAPSRSARVEAELILHPTNATAAPGEGKDYTATLLVRLGRYQFPWNVTGLTRFEIDDPDGCTKVRGTVSCSAGRPGSHTVTGTLPARAIPLVNFQVQGTATLEVTQPEPDHLVLKPRDTTIVLGESVTYTARAVGYDNNDLGVVTGQTDFSMRLPYQPPTACEGATCTPTEVGDHTVTGVLNDKPKVTGTATLHVIRPPPHHLLLEPIDKTIELGSGQRYTAQAVAANGMPLRDVTGQTQFSLRRLQDQSPTACQGAICTPAQKGDYTVTGRFTFGDRTVEGTATLHIIKPPHHLLLEPIEQTIELGLGQKYRAYAVAEDGEVLGEVTDRTDFAITPSGGCQEATCTPTQLGDHTVTGILKDRPSIRGTATLHVRPKQPDHLELDPKEKTIELGGKVAYAARAFAKSNKDLGDVTGQTVFTISRDGQPEGQPSQACPEATCTPTEVGDYTVTGVLNDKPTVTGTAKLHVKPKPDHLPKQPSISSVTPGSTFPGLAVEVGGNTGSCNRAGTLTLRGMPREASVNVTGDEHGDFVVRFTVPMGTFPNAYKLELTVDCNGQFQRAGGELTVINLAPVAVNDAATTTQDTPVAIAVTANDRNPDPDTGYQLVVAEHGSPANGTIQVQPDGVIIYTPSAGFLGQDQFQYGLCDNVINAAGTADCGIATVTVTVNRATSTTTPTGPSDGGSSGGMSSSGGPPCVPSAGDVRQHLQVTPVKGPGGTKLRITATVDPKLAACRLRLLLSGTPLGPDLPVASDGSIATHVPVPPDAIPGSSVLRLATTSGQVLDQTSFEILPALLRRWWERDPYRLLLGVGAVLGGALARAALRRIRRLLQEHDQNQQDQGRRHGLRADPHTRPHELTVAPDLDDRPTRVVRLQPHGDAGALTLQEVPG